MRTPQRIHDRQQQSFLELLVDPITSTGSDGILSDPRTDVRARIEPQSQFLPRGSEPPKFSSGTCASHRTGARRAFSSRRRGPLNPAAPWQEGKSLCRRGRAARAPAPNAPVELIAGPLKKVQRLADDLGVAVPRMARTGDSRLLGNCSRRTAD